MKDQPPLSAAEMREAFDKARAAARTDLEGSGVAQILQYLSGTVASLQANGADIGIAARANAHSNAFDMVYTVSGYGGCTVDAYGYITIGQTSHLWAVASKHNDKPVQRLYLSKSNVVEEGGRITTDKGVPNSHMVIPGDCFDFAEDPEALQKFQKKLISLCADNDAMLDNDRGNVFNREAPAPMQKLAPKFKL